MRTPPSTLPRKSHRKSHDRLNVGFVPTLDCATLIAAKELGLFAKYELDVRLSREVGWATIREKLLHQELDAVATHASMLFSIQCGLGVVQRACLTGLIVASQGSALTLSNELKELGANDAATTGRIIREVKAKRIFSFGVVLGLSTQHAFLRHWLRSGGLNPDVDVRIVVIPSALIYENFRKGFLDGYCVAEPWNSAAVHDNTGWVATTGAEAGSNQAAKVLLVLKDFAEHREEAHLRLIAALIEASRFCDDPAHRKELVRLLTRPGYFDLHPDCLSNSLVGPFNTGRETKSHANLVTYDALSIGAPTQAAGRIVYDMVRSLSPETDLPRLRPEAIKHTFRKDIYDCAVKIAENGGRRLSTAAALRQSALAAMPG